jgi:hypothetical protein
MSLTILRREPFTESAGCSKVPGKNGVWIVGMNRTLLRFSIVHQIRS